MIDRLASDAMRVLADRFGGLSAGRRPAGSADVVGALARRAGGESDGGAHAAARLSGGAGRAERRGDDAPSLPDLFGGTRAAAARPRPRGWRCSRCDAPHLFDAARQSRISGPTAMTGPDNASALRRAGRRRGADVARGASAAVALDALHAHDWQAALAPAICATTEASAAGRP
jgi:starch synthase